MTNGKYNYRKHNNMVIVLVKSTLSMENDSILSQKLMQRTLYSIIHQYGVVYLIKVLMITYITVSFSFKTT